VVKTKWVILDAFLVTFCPHQDILSMNAGPMTFHELYSQYAADVYRFVHWLSGNPEAARDITSETFVRAWTAPGEPRTETIKAYLFAIARNLHRKQWRHDSRNETLDETMADRHPAPDQAMVRNEEYARTIEAMNALPEIDRTSGGRFILPGYCGGNGLVDRSSESESVPCPSKTHGTVET